MCTNRSKQILFVVLGIMLVSSMAPAVLLLPGATNVPLPGTNLPGTVVEDPFRPVAVGPCAFILSDRVTRNGDGTYNFNRFFALAANPLAEQGVFVEIISFVETGFAISPILSVDWDPTTLNGNNSPAVASRSADGNVIAFAQYTPAIMNVGEKTYFTTTQTLAQDYDLVGLCAITIQLRAATGAPIGDPLTGVVQTFAPVPEPASILLLGIGGLLFCRKRR